MTHYGSSAGDQVNLVKQRKSNPKVGGSRWGERWEKLYRITCGCSHLFGICLMVHRYNYSSSIVLLACVHYWFTSHQPIHQIVAVGSFSSIVPEAFVRRDANSMSISSSSKPNSSSTSSPSSSNCTGR